MPAKMSASASLMPSPAKPASTTHFTLSIHALISIALPAYTTTTRFLLALARLMIRSSCLGFRRMVVRSCPSPSSLESLPMQSTTESDLYAFTYVVFIVMVEGIILNKETSDPGMRSSKSVAKSGILYSVRTCEEPPPPRVGCAAQAPATRILPFFKGNTLSSFFKSTTASFAIVTAFSWRCSFVIVTCFFAVSAFSTSSSTFSTRASISASVSSPLS